MGARACAAERCCSAKDLEDGAACQYPPTITDSHVDDVVNSEVGGTVLRHRREMQRAERRISLLEGAGGSRGSGAAALYEELGAACGVLGLRERQLRALSSALELHEGSADEACVARTLASLAAVHEQRADFRREAELRERALALHRRQQAQGRSPTTGAQVADSLALLARAMGRLGKLQRRQELLKEALAMEEQLFGTKSCRAARVLVMLGEHGASQGAEPERAAEMLERALGVLQEEYSWQHPLVVHAIESLADARGQMGETVAQKECLERALVVKEPLFGLHHPQVAVTLVSLGAVCGRLGQRTEWQELLDRASRIVEQSCAALAPRPPHSGACLDKTLCDRPESPSEQLALLRQVVSGLELELGSDHPDAVRARRALSGLGNVAFDEPGGDVLAAEDQDSVGFLQDSQSEYTVVSSQCTTLSSPSDACPGISSRRATRSAARAQRPPLPRTASYQEGAFEGLPE